MSENRRGGMGGNRKLRLKRYGVGCMFTGRQRLPPRPAPCTERPAQQSTWGHGSNLRASPNPRQVTLLPQKPWTEPRPDLSSEAESSTAPTCHGAGSELPATATPQMHPHPSRGHQRPPHEMGHRPVGDRKVLSSSFDLGSETTGSKIPPGGDLEAPSAATSAAVSTVNHVSSGKQNICSGQKGRTYLTAHF